MSDTARGALAHAAGALTPARKVGELLDDYRAEVLTEEAELIVAHCPDHGSRDGVWIGCHCAVADDLRRRAATPAS